MEHPIKRLLLLLMMYKRTTATATALVLLATSDEFDYNVIKYKSILFSDQL